MKRSRWILGVVLVAIGGALVGCNKSAPTEPGWGALDAAAASSPAASLSGVWSGTISFFPFNGDYVVLPCEGTASISATLSHDGVHLTGQFQSGCAGMMQIHGVVSGDRISGSLDSPSSQGYGKIFGTISSNQIQFKTIKFIDEHGDGEPDIDGDGNVTSTEVELHRSPERTSPIAVDRGRSPRVPPAPR